MAEMANDGTAGEHRGVVGESRGKAEDVGVV